MKNKNEVSEQAIKETINYLCDKLQMSDLELYRAEFDDVKSIMELFFDHYFAKTEGSSCSHDKSAYTVRRIKNYLYTGEDSLLKQTYGEYASNGGDIGSITELDEICYWCPQTIEKASDAVKLLFNYLCINKHYFENKLKDFEDRVVEPLEFNDVWTERKVYSCAKCDTKVSKKDNYCKNCGQKLRSS